MVFILLGALKGAKAVRNEYQKDKKRNQVISSLEDSPSGLGHWYGNAAPSSSASSSPPSHNAIGCWSRDASSEPNVHPNPPLQKLPPAQSTSDPSESTPQLREESLRGASGSGSPSDDENVSGPPDEEQIREKAAQEPTSEPVHEERRESSGDSREHKPRRKPPAAPEGSFAASVQLQGLHSAGQKAEEAPGRQAERGEQCSTQNNRGTDKRSSMGMKDGDRGNSGVGRNERAMAAIARKRSAVVSIEGGVGRKVGEGNERAKAALARKRATVGLGRDNSEAESLGAVDRAVTAMARRQSRGTSSAAGIRVHVEDSRAAKEESSEQHMRERGTAGAARANDGSFAEAMRKGQKRSGVSGNEVPQRKETASGAMSSSGATNSRRVDSPGASKGAVTCMYAQGTMKRRVSRKQ